VRWPGGCFADEYHWKDGIGPHENRKEMINTHWGGVVENNHFGTHEFFEFCRQVGCEPYLAGNLGSGTIQEMSEWVEYMTFMGKSPMTRLRAENGREEPWKLKYFGIGNENWGCGGRMTAEHYANEYLRYNTYCRDYGDNRLYRIACGPRGHNYHWTKVLMEKALHFMDGLALHYYSRLKDTSQLHAMADGNTQYTRRPNAESFSATQFDSNQWYLAMKAAYRMEELVSKHSAIMDHYDPDKKVALVVDEWGTWFAVEPGTNPGFLYQQNTLRDALVAGIHLNLFNNHADRVRMANIAQMVNVLQAIILTEGEKMVLTPTYHVFDMYKVHQDAALLNTALVCDNYSSGEGDGLPKISASASRDKAGTINITLCNIDPEDKASVRCVVDTLPGTAKVTGTVLTAGAMNVHNTFDAPNAIAPTDFNGFTHSGDTLTVDLPAKSVVLISVTQ
ncbi:MAG: alpha-N-arabinofuranosidase, partial [Oscillospiraceae bacterium]|nr:alpha-N-arabinofuranosidase [Oscillospiraceae bacterium]